MVLIASLALTALSTVFVHHTARARDEVRFDMAVEESTEQIRHHLRTYVGLLHGGAGLFASMDRVEPADFRAYVDRLRLDDYYKGIQGIGFSRRVLPEQKRGVEALMRREHEGFHIWPEDPRPMYHTIVYLEPLDTLNRRAIGYDMFTNPVRRAAMMWARDSGVAVTSGKVRLVQEGNEQGQSGFLIYVPVYKTDMPPRTVEERRKNLVGFVYSAFRMNDFLEGVFRDEPEAHIRFDIWDSATRTPDHLLYAGQAVAAGFRPEFTKDATLPVPGGARWSVHFETTPAFREASGRDVVPLTLIGGLLISGLLFGITWVQVRSRGEAELAAEALRRSRDAAECTAEELRRSEARARRLVESNVIGVVFEDMNGRITEANDAFLEMVGYTRDDLEAGRLRWTELTPPEYAARDADAVEEVRRTGAHAAYEKEYTHRDGHRIPVLVGAARLEPDSDLAVGFMVDLTERKQAEEALREGREQLRRLYAEAEEARAAAEEANRLKDEFLATVSHELRTPLNAILGYAQLLRIGQQRPEQVARALEAIERNVKAQAQLIEDLLDVSRIVSGKLRLDFQTVDVAEVVRAAVESVAPAAAARSIDLRTDLDPAAGPVIADPHRLQQVAWNLLSNAIKFTPEGGTVEARLRCAESVVEIIVRDTGTGIRPEFLPHVFDRFRQVDSSTTRRHGGLGLGLSIVRNLVEMHGGAVRAESDGEGRGSVFTVTLPRGTDAPFPDESGEDGPQTATGPPLEAPGLDGLRVLVVDDEADAREVVRAILEGHGAEVRTVGSVAAALEVFTKPDGFRPDVLLSDIGMPDEDGYSLIRKVRALGPEAGGGIPAAALTAYARVEDRHRALLAGFQMHVTKPIDPGDLLTIVTTLARHPLRLLRVAPK